MVNSVLRSGKFFTFWILLLFCENPANAAFVASGKDINLLDIYTFSHVYSLLLSDAEWLVFFRFSLSLGNLGSTLSRLITSLFRVANFS